MNEFSPEYRETYKARFQVAVVLKGPAPDRRGGVCVCWLEAYYYPVPATGHHE